ncbi:efflux RND transporter periplasmic adaptor subunit [Laribacter hongkongensis]|uniref:efflux RND transporter periplasmic adaptor subunit n=1 Tax=Laribacter hongkongensis TaxID=168471 RepID=UPI001EFCF0A0|nr:efflux RND transporter periplasmic adaptor subunit [Laribacter hongkongensis]MCG8991377.1 efflux RND transporter periplasmic adaptor subunit [Laribacter hongkongensis]MCG9000541.1 efflux RND transporter periplasmic adaptor subunit [Laribacter hongkongensis]MCG9007006.1 efflux RND transporter periplasmic adaptor subunit [Laribacter hongkongensis]MCG9015324.1 efflux RND transporter periplasmic adaptor subunit [Laribacter hongkongensis]MCG9123523.1 efflux RND transporter periplasmic adaptor su
MSSRELLRRKALLKLTAALLLVALLMLLYWWFYVRGLETTDDAYSAGNLIPVSAQTAGTVTVIGADDTQRVKTGQELVRLDDADARLAVARAEAELAQTVRQTRTLITGQTRLEAVVAERRALVAKAAGDLKRREAASADQSIALEDLQHARDAYSQAQAALQTAEAELQAQRELVMNDAVAKHPQVARAAAQLREAALMLERTRIVAPIDGQIAKRSAQIGMRVQTGAPLMALVPLQTMWVDANFKESQLKDIRIGQPVTVHADVYGNDVSYRGQVAGLSAGTGSVFSLLPPQNATGNWIKVVQRVPVRITLDARDLAAHPLRLGLSMHVSVDTRGQDGPLVTDAPVGKPVLQTGVYDGQLERANRMVADIIAANSAR